jgi:RNA polymerase sigma-70 factor (ECF subfamily)
MEHATDINEQTLINRIMACIRDGDRKSAAASYAVLVKRYSPQVFGFISKMTDNQDDIKDLAQNTFINAFNNLSKFEGRASFHTWVCRIAYNATISHLKAQKMHFVSIDNTNLPDTEVSDEEFSTGDEVRIQQLEAAIDLLPPDDQMLLHLYYYDDKPFKEIAFIMDTDDNTLRVRLHRIRRKLQGMITKSL